MLLLLKCFSFQPPYTIYTSFSSPTNRDVPGTLSIFISSYPRSVLVSFSSLLHNRWKGAWLLMMLEMDRAVKLREREALLLVCTRLAGSGICTQLAFPLDYSRLFTSFFFSFKEFSRLFFFRFRPRWSVRFLQCSSQEPEERFVFLLYICFLLLLLSLTTTALQPYI